MRRKRGEAAKAASSEQGRLEFRCPGLCFISPAGPPAAPCGELFSTIGSVFVCPHLLAELAGVLERPKFRGYVTIVGGASLRDKGLRSDTRGFIEHARRIRDPQRRLSGGVRWEAPACTLTLVSGDGDLTMMILDIHPS